MIARMQIRETAWNSWVSQNSDNRLVRTGATQEVYDAQNPAGFILINVIGSEAEIDELYNQFAAGDRQSIWKWNFNGKVDFATEYTGQHNDILATQPAGSTFEDQNFSHWWLGQGSGDARQRYAREFSREFGEEFN